MIDWNLWWSWNYPKKNMSKVSQIPLHPKWKHIFLTKKMRKKKHLQKCLKNFSWLIGGGHFLGREKKNLDLESPSQTTRNPGLSPFLTPSALRALANLQTFFKSWSSDKKKKQRQHQVISISSNQHHQTESNLVTFLKISTSSDLQFWSVEVNHSQPLF